MTRKKSNKITSVFSIFFSSIKTYFLYLDQCCKYLLFPIFGQIIGIFLIFTCTYYFNINRSYLENNFSFFGNEKNLLLTFYIILSPLFIIFIKAIYDYILAFCALNLLFYTNSNKKKVKNIDFDANKKVIERKLGNYIILMFLVTLIFIPPIILISPIIWIFICLCFQVFSMESDTNAPKALFRSIQLVKGNVIPTVIMLVLCYISTYMFLPDLFLWALEKISVVSFIINKIDLFLQILQLDLLNNMLSIVNVNLDTLSIAKMLSENIITFVIIGFTLPFRSCCFTELYRLYDSEKIKDFSKQSDEIIVRATGKKGKN